MKNKTDWLVQDKFFFTSIYRRKKKTKTKIIKNSI